MKLLLDENLSRRLVPFLQDVFPGSTQVVLVGMERSSDREIWNYAKSNGFAIVTQDADFQELSLLLGHPPHVIWLKLPAPSRSAVLNALLSNRDEIELAIEGQDVGCFQIGR